MKTKKLLAILLVLSLAMCIFPISAFAYSAGYASSTSPWYGVCNGDGVNIRQSASTSSTVLGQINDTQPIEIIGVPNSYWYMVRYNQSGSVGYVYSQYLTVESSNYGRVLHITGVDLKGSKGGSTTVAHAAYNTYMPYIELSSHRSSSWANCVFGRTAGWVDTGNNYDFNYEAI